MPTHQKTERAPAGPFCTTWVGCVGGIAVFALFRAEIRNWKERLLSHPPAE